METLTRPAYYSPGAEACLVAEVTGIMQTHRRRTALTLIELIVLISLLGMLSFLVFLWPRSRGHVPSKRLVCAVNVKGIGTSLKIYANDNGEIWTIPPFDETAIGMIDYTVAPGGGDGSVRSPDRSQPSISGPGGTRQLSGTRSFWMLVRSGDVTVRQFICPSSDDTEDETEDLGLYYDFTGYNNISYGFHVPFGPLGTRPCETIDNRMALAADKGPYVDATVSLPPASLSVNAPPKDWRPYNSPNHGGEGQNVLFADGHASFMRTPLAGVDHDNIYTVALDNARESSRVVGESPWRRSAHPYLPVSETQSSLTSTDSLIFP